MLVSNQASLNKVAPTPTPQTMGQNTVNFGQSADTVEFSTKNQPEEKSFLQKYGLLLAVAGVGIAGFFLAKGHFKGNKTTTSTEKASSTAASTEPPKLKNESTKAIKTEEIKLQQRIRISKKYEKRAEKYQFISTKLEQENDKHWQEFNTKALNAYKKSIAFNPQNPELYCKRGNLFARINEGDIALHNYRQAINVAPNFADAHYNVGTILIQKDPATALIHAQKACEINPLDTQYSTLCNEILQSIK